MDNLSTFVPFTPDSIREEIFYPHIDKLQTGIIVEIGILVCGNLCRIAKYAKEKNKDIKFYGIDNFTFKYNEEDPLLTYHGTIIGRPGGKPNLDSFELCMTNIIQTDTISHIRLIPGNSTEVSYFFDDESIDLIFLDTTHTYEHITNEFVTWTNKVKNGGIISGHDWNMERVSDAVKEFFPKHDIHVVADNTGFWLQK